MRTSWACAVLTTPRMTWRVVCGLELEMAILEPTRAFVSVDLPALGRPTRHMNPEWKPGVVASATRAAT